MMKKRMRGYSSTEIRKFFSEATGRAHWRKERVKIFRYGTFALAIVPPEDFQWLRARECAKEECNARHLIEVKQIYTARQKMAEFLDDVYENHCRIMVYKFGEPYVVFLPPDDFSCLPSFPPAKEDLRAYMRNWILDFLSRKSPDGEKGGISYDELCANFQRERQFQTSEDSFAEIIEVLIREKKLRLVHLAVHTAWARGHSKSFYHLGIKMVSSS
jgi:hypothetical protein